MQYVLQRIVCLCFEVAPFAGFLKKIAKAFRTPSDYIP
jgi:hypothetical protein